MKEEKGKKKQIRNYKREGRERRMRISGRVVGDVSARYKHRWFGILEVETEDKERLSLYMSGSVAQWLNEGEHVEVHTETRKPVLLFDEYELFKFCENCENGENAEKGGKSEKSEKSEKAERSKLKVWPVWERDVNFERRDALDIKTIYTYKLRAREAVFEADYEEIAELEQYHYASQKKYVAVWRCEKCHELIEANTKPLCSKCGTDEHVHILEIKGSTPASRFLIIEHKKRKAYEPRVLAYVRVDPPVPMMHRLLPSGDVVKNIRERVFDASWFSPSFSPEREKRELFEELRREGKSSRIARRMLWERVRWRAIAESNTAAARIARVVVHPDYRSDGIGQLAVRLATEWIKERRIPEMRREKKLVEVIAQMARFNPFFEKAGFKYLWDTSSGKPVLYRPLTDDAAERINQFLKTDKYAMKHKGRLFISRYGKVEMLNSDIILENVTKIFGSELDIEGVSSEVLEVLQAFQVRHRQIQREVLRNLSIRISPGEIVCVVGASGAGKTTFLRILAHAALKKQEMRERVSDEMRDEMQNEMRKQKEISDEKSESTSESGKSEESDESNKSNESDERRNDMLQATREEACVPDVGRVLMPDNVRAGVIIPGEIEPRFGDESIIEHVFRKCNDPHIAVEVLSVCGLSDAVLWRARFQELSTGQKERAKIASVFAEKPNLIIIDEFAAHLDPLAARRVARKVSELCRNAGITLVVATHRPEVKDALAPQKMLYIGYGTYFVTSERIGR